MYHRIFFLVILCCGSAPTSHLRRIRWVLSACIIQCSLVLTQLAI